MVSGKCFSDLLMLLCMLMIGGELGKQKQLELRIAADCLNGGAVQLWESQRWRGATFRQRGCELVGN